MSWVVSRRNMVMVAASLVAVPVTVAQLVLGQSGPTRATWQLLCAFVLPLVAIALERQKGRGALALVPALVIALGPLLMLQDSPSEVDAVMVVLIPLAGGLLFFDHFRAVVSVLVLSTASASLFLVQRAQVSAPALATLVLSLVGVSVVLAITSHWLMQVRTQELSAEQQRSQALRLSETKRAQTERLAIVGRLASGVAHEINNPLAYVKANVGVLRRELFTVPALSRQEATEMLEETASGIDRICSIVADLKSLAREGTEELEPVELRELVEGAVRLASVRLPAGMRVTVAVPENVVVRANRRKLSQVVLNLLVNAGEALDDAKPLQPEIVVRAERALGDVTLAVEDNGSGLPDAVQQRLFEPFFTTKGPGKGTGLGLALSREYLAGFGATIRAQNGAAGGARFVVTLKATTLTGETPMPGRLVA